MLHHCHRTADADASISHCCPGSPTPRPLVAAFKQQNGVHGLPMELSEEEVTLAVERGWGVLQSPAIATAQRAAHLQVTSRGGPCWGGVAAAVFCFACGWLSGELHCQGKGRGGVWAGKHKGMAQGAGATLRVVSTHCFTQLRPRPRLSILAMSSPLRAMK